MKSSQIINILLFIGAAQGLFLSVTLLAIKRTNRIPNILLSGFIMLFSFMIFFHSLGELQGSRHTPGREHSPEVFFFLFGPLIYFYVLYMTDRDFKIKIKHSLHFLPFLLCSAFIGLIENVNLTVNIWYLVSALLIVFVTTHYSVYLFYCIKILHRYSNSIRDSFSSIDRINLSWMRLILISQMIIWPLGLFVEFAFQDEHSWNYIWLLVSVSIYVMGYKSMMQPEIHRDIPLARTDKNSLRKYEKSTLNPDTAEEYYSKLLLLMENEKPYLNPDITLQALAEKMNVSIHHLSQVINEKCRKNFFELINSYRVEEAKKLLVNPEKKFLTISAIAYEAGFNTLSSFNSAFKRFTNITPSQFRAS